MFSKIKSFFYDRIPPLTKWRYLPRVLNKTEKIILAIAFFLFVTSLITFFISFYLAKTKIIPTFGGSYSEGIIGSPRFLNPIYGLANDVDRDITSLLFSELMEHSFSQGFIFNMIESIDDQGRSVRIKLREDLRWSDGERITARDIIFTIKIIQDPEYKSPLRPNWVGIRAEEISELEVIFHLERPAVAFLNNLSLQIIPSHIWQDIPAHSFPLSRYNLNPIGSGPYRIKEIKNDYQDRIREILLEANPYYHRKRPYIENLSFVFFDNQEDLLWAAQRREIDGFSVINPNNYQAIMDRTGFYGYSFQIPRYFALFFNLASENTPEKKIRSALSLAIDKEALIQTVLAGRGQKINSPVLPAIYGLDVPDEHQFNPKKAEEILDSLELTLRDNKFRSRIIREKAILEFNNNLQVGSRGEEVRNLERCLVFISENNPEIFPAGTITGFYGEEVREAVVRLQEKYRAEILEPFGFTTGTGMVAQSTRQKLNELCREIPEESVELKFTITTVDQPLMIETAEMIKSQWEAIGIRTEISVYAPVLLEREVIKPRNYDILLLGKAFGNIPDLFPFWHSSQKSEFGLNLAMYANEEADTILELLQEERDGEKRISLFNELQNIIIKDSPAIFLFNPDYLYFVSPRISGIRSRKINNPSKRLSEIENWYINTKRVLIER